LLKEDKGYLSPHFLAVSEAAKYLGVNKKMIYLLLGLGEISPFRERSSFRIERKTLVDFRMSFNDIRRIEPFLPLLFEHIILNSADLAGRHMLPSSPHCSLANFMQDDVRDDGGDAGYTSFSWQFP
jgi:excisionase family DNA binding protein